MVQEQTSAAQSTVTIQGIHHSGVACNNLERAVEFYTKVLGMKLAGPINSDTLRAHFLGAGMPKEDREQLKNEEGERDLKEFLDMWQRERPGEPQPSGRFARMKAGDDDLVLFERLSARETTEQEMLLEAGIFHLSYYISPEDMERVLELHRQGDSDIRLHTGPVRRGLHGWAIYLWDTEGNYVELEAPGDLPGQSGGKP